MKFSAAVIGLGKIGQGYDYDSSDGSTVLTHASGFQQHPGFDLIAGVDPDAGARERFSLKYCKPAYSTPDELFDKHRLDVVSIAASSGAHRALFEKVVETRPQGILLEKPAGVSLTEARAISDLAYLRSIKTLVNYVRRFEPEVLKLRKRLQAGEFGAVKKGVVWYTNGLKNNASHFVDLMLFLFGEAKSCAVLSSTDQIRKLSSNDIEPDFKIQFGETEVYFLAGQEECFSLAEFELMTSEGRIQYRSSGEEIVIQKVKTDPLFPGYRIVDTEGERIRTELSRYQFHVVEALHQWLTGGQKANSDIQTAVQTAYWIDHVIQLSNSQSSR